MEIFSFNFKTYTFIFYVDFALWSINIRKNCIWLQVTKKIQLHWLKQYRFNSHIISALVQVAGVLVAQHVRASIFVILFIFPHVHKISAEVPAIISAFKARRRNLEVFTSCMCPFLSSKHAFLEFSPENLCLHLGQGIKGTWRSIYLTMSPLYLEASQ